MDIKLILLFLVFEYLLDNNSTNGNIGAYKKFQFSSEITSVMVYEEKFLNYSTLIELASYCLTDIKCEGFTLNENLQERIYFLDLSFNNDTNIMSDQNWTVHINLFKVSFPKICIKMKKILVPEPDFQRNMSLNFEL